MTKAVKSDLPEKIRNGAGIALLVVAILAGAYLFPFVEAYLGRPSGYMGVEFSESQREVEYALGAPVLVSGERWSPCLDEKWSKEDCTNDALMRLSGFTQPKDIPDRRTIYDYFVWLYLTDGLDGGVMITFGPDSEEIASIVCRDATQDYSATRSACDPVYEIGLRSSENAVLEKLGPPSSEMVFDGTKSMVYVAHGVQFWLHKRAVFAIIVFPGWGDGALEPPR